MSFKITPVYPGSNVLSPGNNPQVWMIKMSSQVRKDEFCVIAPDESIPLEIVEECARKYFPRWNVDQLAKIPAVPCYHRIYVMSHKQNCQCDYVQECNHCLGTSDDIL